MAENQKSKIFIQLLELLEQRKIGVRKIAKIAEVPYVTLNHWIYHPDEVDPQISNVEAVLAALGYSLQIVTTTGKKTLEQVEYEEQQQKENEKLREVEKMEKYVCNECGEVFDENQIKVKQGRQKLGEAWGVMQYEEYRYEYCPYCDSDNIQPYDDFEDFLDEDEF